MQLAARGWAMKVAVVEGGDGLGMGDAGGDHLPPAGPAGHEVRLDQAGRDLELGLDQAAVEADHGAARGAADQDMVLVLGGDVVYDPDLLQHPGVAHELGQLLALVRAVQAGGDEHGDALARHARLDQGADQGRPGRGRWAPVA